MTVTKLSIRPRVFKRYGTTTSRSHYGTLDKARQSAVADLRRLSKEKNQWQRINAITVYDANIGDGDYPTKENIIGTVVFNWYGTPCWTDKKGNITHRINKDGTIRRM